MSKALDPLGTPAIWREFLFNSVLLIWEAGRLKAKPWNFDKRILDSELRLLVLRKSRLADMDAAETQFAKHPGEFLVMYREGPGWASVFKSMRDMVAHGDFVSHKRGWITIRHRYKGTREKVESTRLFGSLKFQTLRALVQFINLTHKN